MRVLGLETSCDETGVALYDSERGIVAEALYSQTELHAKFGGVVPELASRDHLQKILPLVDETLINSGLDRKAIDAIAYTRGPGLIGALMIGAMWGRALAMALNIRAVGVHHLEGHLLAPFLEPTSELSFPFIALLVSGGHTALIEVTALGQYKTLGDTLDDAVGEAFDKTAKLLGLGYPGGAKLSALAAYGIPNRFQFPRPMVNRTGLDFSFSGLKTYALNTIQSHTLDDQTKADIAHAFQKAVVETLVIKCKRAIDQTGIKKLVVAGGVGANIALRAELKGLGERMRTQVYFPTPAYCTDNGAMIAYAGFLRLQQGDSDGLDMTMLPRWPIDDLTPPGSKRTSK